MKKAITILAILIVLVSAVFAETHTLKIKATQADIYPAFQMYVKNVTSGSKDSAVITNADKTEFGAEDPNPDTAPYVAPVAADPDHQPDPIPAVAEANVAASFSFEAANTVTVAVKIANAAKTAQNYSLSFTGGSFNVNKNGVGSYKSGGTDEAPVMSNYTVGTESITAAAGDGSSADGSSGFKTTASGSGATVDFSGKTCTIDAEVATCEYAYNAHTDVDPGTYYADIILTVATTN